jgi:hypothetical protein
MNGLGKTIKKPFGLQHPHEKILEIFGKKLFVVAGKAPVYVKTR